MSNIVPAGYRGQVQRRSRAAGRALTRIDGQTEIGLAEIEAKADLQVARVRGVSFVGRQALHEVAMLSQLEQQLAALVPMATGRLQAICDMVALDTAEIVADTVRQVTR